MRKQIYILLISSVVLLSACNDFLTENVRSEFDSETLFTSESGALAAVNGLYKGMSFQSSDNLLWLFGDVASDDAVKGGNPGDQADFGFIDDFSANAENGALSIYWQYTYDLIAQCNNVIAYVPAIESISPDLRNRLVAEAKFIRAYSYFNLVNVWGKVPLKLKPQNEAANIHVPLSEVAVIYAQINTDLTDASILPDQYAASTDLGRVTKGAVYALQAKLNLFQQDWDGCLSAIDQLEKLNKYDLVYDYADLFKVGSEDSVEVIFAARHMTDQVPRLGNSLNQWFAPSTENGYYFNAPTESYVESFNELTIAGETDPRLDVSIGRDGQPWFNRNTFSASWSMATGYLVKKHNQPLSEVPSGRKGDGYLPFIYLRYADVLLMKAEALNEQKGNDAVANAAIALNKVRGRAGLAPTTANNESALREVIRKERRRELGFESHRFFDLMRWEKEPRFYFPIPQSETDANQAL